MDAETDVLRGLQVVEHCCSITSLQVDETMPNISHDMDTHSYRGPLGVCADVTRGVAVRKHTHPQTIREGTWDSHDAGGDACPDRMVNVIHGQHVAVNFMGNRAGRYVYEIGSKNGKRVEAIMGAKNHGVIMPDANKESTLTQLGINFYTQLKTVTQLWRESDVTPAQSATAMSVMC